MPFRFAQPPIVSEVHPLGGPSVGGAMITVFGSGFVDDGGVDSECEIGDYTRCEMHRHAIGMRRVDRPTSGLRCIFGPRHLPASESVAVHATLVEGTDVPVFTW